MCLSNINILNEAQKVNSRKFESGSLVGLYENLFIQFEKNIIGTVNKIVAVTVAM